MIRYRNRVTGQVIVVPCKIGGDWEEIGPVVSSQSKNDEQPVQTPKRRGRRPKEE